MPARDQKPKESVVQTRVLADLRAFGCWAVNIHGDPMQPKTIDIIASVPTELYIAEGMGGVDTLKVGLTLGIECKRQGEGYTLDGSRLISDDPLQEYELQTIRDAGGWAAVVDEPALVRRALAAWPHVCRMCLRQEGDCDC